MNAHSHASRRWRLVALQFVLVFFSFAIANEIGYYFLVENQVSIFYPATAVDVLACMKFGVVGAVAVVLAYIATPWDAGSTLGWLLLGGLLNALHGAIPALIFRWRRNLHSDLRDLRSFGAYLLFGTILNSAVFAFLGNVLLIGRPAEGWTLRPFVIWWISDFAGTLLIATPLLAYGNRVFDWLKGVEKRRAPRTIVNALEVSAAIILLGWLASTAIRTNIIDSFEKERITEQQTWARAGRLLTVLQRNLIEASSSLEPGDPNALAGAEERHLHFLTRLTVDAAAFPTDIRSVFDRASRETTSWFRAARQGQPPDEARRQISNTMVELRLSLDAANENRWAEFAVRRERIKRVTFLMDVLLFVILGLALSDLIFGISRPLTQMHGAIASLRNGATFDADRIDAPFVELQSLAETIDETSKALRDRERELRVQTDRALTASRHKSDFLARMSHELRTPLNSILGFSELLMEREGTIEPPKRRAFLENIWRSGSNLLRLINDLLDIARIESGKLTLARERVDLRHVVENSVASTAPLFERRRQTVEVSLSDRPLLVLLDAQRIEQVLLNLLANANKYSGEGSHIEVVAGEREGELFISVSDDGVGIAPEDHRRVFEDFEQVGSPSEGTGLGLALARRFVEAHGGRIELTSHPGQGATFSVILPRLLWPEGGRE
jgi:signal transduction histidine kinase